MTIQKWLQQNTHSLVGRTVAITGSTGGLGTALCRHLAGLGASLLLLDRNQGRQATLCDTLRSEFPNISLRCLSVDLEQPQSVRALAAQLKHEKIDVFVHNAGAYAIPRHQCDTGLDNVFQINFASPYYLIRTLLPQLRERHGHVVVVGSIAHNYSKADPADVDFSTRKRASLVYGNAKRYLTYSLFELFREERDVTMAVTHPGISQTNITAHYPKAIYALIKYPMRLLFMRPKKASLSILKGVFEPCRGREWIGPWLFAVWGLPKKRPLGTAGAAEIAEIAQNAEKIYRNMKEPVKAQPIPMNQEAQV